MNKRVRHFTAKELAVVVALLCVLTGALIGALTATRRATRGERCLARLRQMGVAMQLYVAANDEYLPLIAYGRLPDVTLFADALRPYAKHHEDLWICPDGDMRPATIASGNGRLLHYGMNDFGYTEVADCVNNYLPTLSGARERGRRAVCLNNLSQIAIAMKTYSADYDEYLPPHFYSLAKHGTMPMIFVCPTAGTAPADSMAPSAFLRANCSYNLVVYKNAGTGG